MLYEKQLTLAQILHDVVVSAIITCILKCTAPSTGQYLIQDPFILKGFSLRSDDSEELNDSNTLDQLFSPK